MIRLFTTTLLTLLFWFSIGIVDAQSKNIAYSNLLELESMVRDNDYLYLCGSVPHAEVLKSYPVLLCTTLEGDTVWTKEFLQFQSGGKFKQIIVVDDTLYVSGSIKSDLDSYEDVLLKITKKGKILGGYTYPVQTL